VTAAVSHGSSGSPILDANGRVIGVAVGFLAGGESLNFGVPVEYARALLDAAKPGAKAAPLTKAKKSLLWRNLGISLAVFVSPWLGYALWARFARRRRRSPLH
jgi:S1-C subfamily serine protease